MSAVWIYEGTNPLFYHAIKFHDTEPKVIEYLNQKKLCDERKKEDKSAEEKHLHWLDLQLLLFRYSSSLSIFCCLLFNRALVFATGAIQTLKQGFLDGFVRGVSKDRSLGLRSPWRLRRIYADRRTVARLPGHRTGSGP